MFVFLFDFLQMLYFWFSQQTFNYPDATTKLTSLEKSKNYIPPELRNPIDIQAARELRKITRKNELENRKNRKNREEAIIAELICY
jgi:hypothetical protein